MFSVTNYSGFAVPVSARAIVPPGPAWAWYDFADATQMTTSGTAITTMADKSGNGFHLNNGGAAYIGSGINGLSAGNFAPLGYLRRVVGSFIAPGPNAFSFSMVARLTTATNLGVTVPFNCNPGQAPMFFISDVETGFTVQMSNDGPFAACDGPPIPNNGLVYSGMLNPGTQTARVDGGVYSSTFSGGGTNTNTTTDLTIGGLGTLGKWPGYIGEVRLFNTFIGTSLLYAEEGYLAWKWGLQGNLPSNHPYKNSPP